MDFQKRRKKKPSQSSASDAHKRNTDNQRAIATLSPQGVERKAKKKIRTIIRRQRKSADKAREQMDQSVDIHFLRRLNRLFKVRRFVLSWLLLALLLAGGAWWQVSSLDQYYLQSAPVGGGAYREGIIGSFTNSNPLYATSGVDASVSQLLYSSLFSVNGDGTLRPRLASRYVIDETQKIYTVDLRRDVLWHDGERFDADDVLYTYKTIQNSDARSPLYNSWRSVNVKKIDDYKVQFELPNIYSAFHYSLTNGIVPEHVLGPVQAEELRSSLFNTTKPIGTGEFKLDDLTVSNSDDIEKRSEKLILLRNDDYYSDKPLIDSVIIRTYRNEDLMLEAFDQDVIQSMVGLDSIPDEIVSASDVEVISAPLTSSVMLFFNNSNSFLSDKNVRRALVQSVDTEQARASLGFDTIPVDSPFLRSQKTYDKDIVQLPYDEKAAQEGIEKAGWKRNADGIYEKDGNELQIRLFSQSLGEYSDVISQIQEDWTELGVRVNVFLQSEADIQSGAIARHDYDALLYGISIGYDPDVFAYWHSSQIDTISGSGLNLSEFSNELADEALEAGRTRNDLELRKIKYEPFLESWRDDAPAFGIYQPRFTMVVRGTFTDFDTSSLRSSSDRYRSVSQWRVRNDKVPKQLVGVEENL